MALPPTETDMAIRALLWMPGGSRVPGGHVVQLEQTALALRRAGLQIATHLGPDPTFEPAGFDVVHGFGLSSSEIRQVRMEGVPVVLSSIYWERAYRSDWAGQRDTLRGLASRLKRAARFALAGSSRGARLLELCLKQVSHEVATISAFESADLLLPNADGEAAAIRNDLHVTTPIMKIPNGVDPHQFYGPNPRLDARQTVLYVGRVEPHKNQLGLINALKGSEFQLVIAGYEHPDHKDYADMCHREGRGWVQFVGPFSPDDAADLYRSARVHILPSWFETTGLVSLEAALCGCNIVSTSRGYAREYFGEHAWYCDPGQPSSILNAVHLAWESPSPLELREHILHNYTWDHVAAHTLSAYRKTLNRT